MDEKKNDLIEIAKKKRYIALVENLNRRSLSSKELRELEALQKYFETAKPVEGVIDPTVDLATLCVYMDKSPRMVRRYVSQGMPIMRDSAGEIARFKVGEVFKWYYGLRLGEDVEGQGYWKNEVHKTRAQLNQLVLQKEKGKLIALKDHVVIVKNQIRGIKAGFLRLPKYIAPKLFQQEPKIICEIIDSEIRYIINQFASAKNADKNQKGNS